MSIDKMANKTHKENEMFYEGVTMNGEVWKDVVGYEGHYKISNMGRLMTLEGYHKRKEKGIFKKKAIIRKLSKHSSGYLRTSLCSEGIVKYHYIHVLVLEAFVCKRPNKQDVDHKNRDRTDNNLINLRWLNRRENRGKIGYENNNNKIKRYVRNK